MCGALVRSDLREGLLFLGWQPDGMIRLNFSSPEFLTQKKGNEKVKQGVFSITGQRQVLESEGKNQSLDDIGVEEGLALCYQQGYSSWARASLVPFTSPNIAEVFFLPLPSPTPLRRCAFPYSSLIPSLTHTFLKKGLQF